MNDNRRRRLPPPAAMLLAFVLLLAACGGSGEKPETPPAANDGTIAENVPADDNPAPEPPAAGFRAPLTGLPSDKPLEDRPVAVMINNFAKARPQSGLTHADVVWEVLAEGGITRLIAVFQSESFGDPIGPIRSIRPYLIDLAESYQAVIVHAGASNDAYAILQRQRKHHLDEITNAGGYFWRDKARKAPHNLYSSLDKLREGADKKGYDTAVPIPQLTFMDEPAAPAGGIDASSVELTFLMKDYKVSYAYDAERKVYLRSINGKPHTDLTGGEQLSAANLAVLGAGHQVLDDVGRLAVDLESGGPAKLIRLGKAVDAEWRRGPDGTIRLYADGQELPLVPGKTYYHVVPMTPSFEGHIAIG